MRWWLAIALCACDGTTPAMPDGTVAGDDAPMPDAAPPARLVAYVSGGANIDWYDVDQTTGALASVSSIAAFRPGASFLAFRGTTHLYAVTSGNRVGAYSIDPATAALTFINDVASGGNGPTHVAVDRTGAFVMVANYGGGNVSVFPIQGNGGLGAAVQTLASGANAHLIDSDPSNRYVFVPCLGVDYVAQYVFAPATGMLTPNAVPRLMTANGAGPRHLAFSPDGKHAYLINELDSTLSALSLDGGTGRLTTLDTLTTRAAGASGGNTTAEVVVHPSGKFVYGSNRGDDNIVVFARDGATGMISLVEHESTQGMTPRNFTVDPTGKFLYAANQNSGSVVPFAIDAATGALTPTATPITVPAPAFVGVLAMPAP
jgi:6-phosphogluconolactonase